MMESSEQCAYDGSMDPNDSSSGTARTGLQIVAKYEDYAREVIPLNQGDDEHANEQVLGYLDQENATIVLQSPGLELDGKQIIFTQGSGADEIILFVSDQDPSVEHAFEESVSGNSSDNHTFAIQSEAYNLGANQKEEVKEETASGNSVDNHTLTIECGSDNLQAVKKNEVQEIEVFETNDGVRRIVKNGTVYVEQAQELAYVDSDNNHYSSEDLGNAVYHIQDKDDTTEMVFIPTTSQVISTGNNTRLLHLADVAHSEWATSELHGKEEAEYTTKSELSVIVKQIRAESDCHSSKVENAAIIVVNEQENTNSLHEEPMAVESKTTSSIVEENPPLLPVPARDIDNAVSVIHVTSSTLIQDQDWRTKNIQEDEIQTEETCQSDTSVAAKSTNVKNLECSHLKETLDSELSSQSVLLEESNNHSHLKDGTDNSNQDDDVSYETSTAVGEPMEEDTNESIHFDPQSDENIDHDDSKEKDTIICKDNDSNTSTDVDQSQNLDNKISDPSSKDCDKEMDFINSEEACSETHTSPARTFSSLKDNSELKSSVCSDNSLPKDLNLHNFKKLESDTSSKAKKAIDEYEFENSSSNLDQELSHNSSLSDKCVDIANSNDISAEVDITEVNQSGSSDVDALTGNPTFQGTLTLPVTDSTKVDEDIVDEDIVDENIDDENVVDENVVDENVVDENVVDENIVDENIVGENIVDENIVDEKNGKTYDNSQDLFDESSQENDENITTNATLVKNKENSVINEINHTDKDKNSDEKIVGKKSVNISTDSVNLKVVSSGEAAVKPPQRTYIRKRKNSDKNMELFSLDDLPEPEDDKKENKNKNETPSYLTPKIFIPDKQEDQTLDNEKDVTDEDGYVNLMPSDMDIIINNSTSSSIDERETRGVRPQSSDHLQKIVDPESASWGVYLMGTSFKSKNVEKTEDDTQHTEDDTQHIDDTQHTEDDIQHTEENTTNTETKASPENVLRAESPKIPNKKRVRIPSHKKITTKAANSKSIQQWDKLIKSSSIKMKHASSDKRKVREKVKKQVEKKLRNSENLNSSKITSSQSKKAWLSKNGERPKTLLQLSSSIPKKLKTCGFKFFNNSTVKNNSAIDGFSTASTSTQDLKDFQYACTNCSNFVSNKVNNLITHLRYCTKPSDDMIDYRVNDMNKRQRIRGDFTESDPTSGNSSTPLESGLHSSENLSNSSVISNNEDESECLSSPEEELHEENEEENKKENDYDNQEEQPKQTNIDNEKMMGYEENEIAWAAVNKRFWPALVHKIREKEFEIYLIDYPTTKRRPEVTNVHMKIGIDSLPQQLHSYNDVKFQKKLLAKAGKLPDKDLFFKAVQRADSYARKRLIYNKGLDGYAFLNIGENVELAAVTKGDVDMIDIDEDEDEEQCVDMKELMECIFQKKCDKHVIGIYKGVIESERHNLHRNKNKEAASRLKNMSWFGPFKNNAHKQIKLHDYFIDLFKSKFGTRKDLISYIYEVWIPEGIIKAISIVNHISLLEAQIIFYKQDMTSIDIEDFELDCEDS